ncbi:MAG: hypothetical protein IPG94_21130 [Kineosporiaceae bacterium]|nr:hypothetical protein [Kineosporiaceae bacterium]
MARGRLAAFSATNGALLSWAPTANLGVRALLALTARNKVIIAGSFGTVNGVTQRGTAAVDLTTGAGLAWPANQTVLNGGSSSEGISSLATDGSRVYATGFRFGNLVTGHLEGSYAADLDGNLQWVNGCRGDQYGVYSDGTDIYQVGHAHDCSSIGGFPESSTYRRALSFSIAAQTTNVGGAFNGQPGPSLTGWQPTLNAGPITGLEQGPWHITGNGQYLVLGGEFTAVNGVQQRGAGAIRRDCAPRHDRRRSGLVLAQRHRRLGPRRPGRWVDRWFSSRGRHRRGGPDRGVGRRLDEDASGDAQRVESRHGAAGVPGVAADRWRYLPRAGGAQHHGR